MYQDVIEYILKNHALRDAFRAIPRNTEESFYLFFDTAVRLDRFPLSWMSWPTLIDHLAAGYESCYPGVSGTRGAVTGSASRWLYTYYPTDGLVDGCPCCGWDDSPDVLGKSDCPECDYPFGRHCRLCLGGRVINVVNKKTGEPTMICPCQRPNWPRPPHMRPPALKYVGKAMNWI